MLAEFGDLIHKTLHQILLLPSFSIIIALKMLLGAYLGVLYSWWDLLPMLLRSHLDDVDSIGDKPETAEDRLSCGVGRLLLLVNPCWVIGPWLKSMEVKTDVKILFMVREAYLLLIFIVKKLMWYLTTGMISFSRWGSPKGNKRQEIWILRGLPRQLLLAWTVKTVEIMAVNSSRNHPSGKHSAVIH